MAENSLEARVAVLEDAKRRTDEELKNMRSIAQELHSAKAVGKAFLGAALILGGLIGWIVTMVTK